MNQDARLKILLKGFREYKGFVLFPDNTVPSLAIFYANCFYRKKIQTHFYNIHTMSILVPIFWQGKKYRVQSYFLIFNSDKTRQQ